MNTSNLTGKLGIFDEQSTMPDGLQLGQEKVFSDGRKFRLAKNGGTALAAGKLCIQGDPVTNHLGMTPSSASAGETSVTVTLGATEATANQYKDGYLIIRTEGTMYKIKSHPAADASATLQVELYDGLKVALGGDEEVDLVYHPLDGVVVTVADQADVPVGVPMIAVTASYYFWLQVAGPAPVLMDENIGRGDMVTIGSATVGAVEMHDAVGEPLVGQMIEAGVDTKYNLVQLMLG